MIIREKTFDYIIWIEMFKSKHHGLWKYEMSLLLYTICDSFLIMSLIAEYEFYK